ncbi:MAG TPA: glycoside hydrolase family 3 N-terminal domain-containing protein [Solirubrobacteraceae bacterium]|nr:glycoside hydrolase family 3 N-terminal domain-containing protein [Solirubrobacteraceae bacterium]
MRERAAARGDAKSRADTHEPHDRRRRAGCAFAAAVLAATVAGCGGSETVGHTITVTKTVIRHTKPTIAKAPKTRPSPSLAHAGSVPVNQMLGQMIVSPYAGDTPPPALLNRVRAGEVGGVILFSENTAAGEASTRAQITELQAAASAGGKPPLLIMTDQEGGEVRRLTWAPPFLAAADMRSVEVAQAEGAATGRALREVGVNLDLAPVSDVVHVANSFLGTRSFGDEPLPVSERACAFASGLASAGVGYTLKHFPGLGRALGDTDNEPVTINASAQELRADYATYVLCASNPSGVVMVSNATYPALTGNSTPAVMSPEIYKTELGQIVGYHGVTISDALGAGALAHDTDPAERAIDAGLDLALYAGTEGESVDAYATLREDLRTGGIPHSRVEDAYNAIMALKAKIAGAAPQTTANYSQASSYPEDIGPPETISPEKGK